MKEKLFKVVVGDDKIKIICRQINGLFQDVNTNCIYGSSVIDYEEIKGTECPKCGSTNTFKREENPKSTLYKCKDCWLVFDES